MGVNRVFKRGRERIEVRRRWPDKTTFRRYYPNMKLANEVYFEIEVAIAQGTWRELKRQLQGEDHAQGPRTFGDCANLFLEKHAKLRMRSWTRYRLSLRLLCEELGDLLLTEFHRSHLHGFVEKRTRMVKPATVNRDIACCKKMFSFALEMGWVEHHPLVRFPLLPTQEMAHRALEVPEFRKLVTAIEEPGLQALVAVMGETGIRKGEALKLEWRHVDLRNRLVTIEQTKSGKVREVPLSAFAVEKLMQLPRYLDEPRVFVNTMTERPWINPEKAFKKASREIGLPWVGFHDLRRFRATQWVRAGVDVRTVQQLLGHADIQTTLKYVRFVRAALEEVREIQESEAQNLQKAWETNGRQRQYGRTTTIH